MTKRAILWCGHVRERVVARDELGRARELDDPLLPTDDFKIQCNSLELAFKAALSLGVPDHEIHACVIHEDLLPQGFDPRRRHPATVDGLRRLARDLAERAGAEDPLLVIALNHGDEDALVTADPPLDEFDEDRVVQRLTPGALEDCLRPLRGPQVVVVATCHAGIFLPLAAREGRAVLVACPADAVYWVSREGCAWPAFLDELFGAWCECSLSDAVPRDRLALDEAFARAAARLAEAGAANLPLRAGAAAWPR
jgi:hypothetical protein